LVKKIYFSLLKKTCFRDIIKHIKIILNSY
jgi:hypothetical protein